VNPIDVFGSTSVSGSIRPEGSAGVSRSSVSSDSTRRPCSLSGLSDNELLSRVKELAARERAVTLEILLHLIEVERRRLHVGLGYASMFDYCTRQLRYSSSAASRRIQAARCIRDYPEVYGLLQRNEVNLVTISLVASILTESNAKDVLAKIRGKTQREVEEIASAYRPPVALRDRARPVWVAEPAPRGPQLNGPRGDLPPTSGSEISPNVTASGAAGGPPQAPSMMQALLQAGTQAPESPPSPRRIQKRLVQFVASERFMKKLERARALLSNGRGAPTYEFVLEAALDEFLKDHDPEERNKRRETRREKAEAGTKSANRAAEKTSGNRSKSGVGSAGCGSAEGPPCSSVTAGCGRVDGHAVSAAKAGSGQADDPLFRRWIGGLPAPCVPAVGEGASRRIPAAIKDAVFARDKGRCTYVGSNGERCAATHHLQIDHVIPYARGGTNSLGNLRLLCERHNKKEAERVYGANAMKKFRARE
jgi:hypothetical protein